MKRSFLKDLGLEDEVVDKIMTENGKDINDLKVEVTNLKSDLAVKDGVIATKDTKISELEKVDIEGLKKAEYEKGKTEGSAEVGKFKFENALKEALAGFKPKDAKVVSSLLDMTKIKYENDKITGLDEQITPLKTSHDYLFESDKKIPRFADKAPGIENNPGEKTVKQEIREKLFGNN
jgi:hypothetical protein